MTQQEVDMNTPQPSPNVRLSLRVTSEGWVVVSHGPYDITVTDAEQLWRCIQMVHEHGDISCVTESVEDYLARGGEISHLSNSRQVEAERILARAIERREAKSMSFSDIEEDMIAWLEEQDR